MGRWVVGLVIVGAWLAVANPAAALCNCGDRDGCGSAGGCVGKSPGDACTSRRTCKIRIGTGNDATCCCGCTPGNGPIGCNYGAVSVAGALEGPVVACNAERLTRVASKAATKADAKLQAADAACQGEKRADKKADAATNQLTRLGKKIDRLAERGEVTTECAGALRGLLQDLTGEITAVETGTSGGTTTTTTSLPSGPSCSTTFSVFDPNEIDFLLTCASGGPFDAFLVRFEDGRVVTNWLEPPGFACALAQFSIPNDSLECTGTFSSGSPVTGGRIRTTPPPTSNLNAELFVLQGSSELGPFPTSGP